MEIATHCEHSWEFQFFLEMKMEMEIDMHCVRANSCLTIVALY